MSPKRIALLAAGALLCATAAFAQTAGTGNGTAQSINVYGQVPAQATPKPDTYQTTVTATVYF